MDFSSKTWGPKWVENESYAFMPDFEDSYLMFKVLQTERQLTAWSKVNNQQTHL